MILINKKIRVSCRRHVKKFAFHAEDTWKNADGTRKASDDLSASYNAWIWAKIIKKIREGEIRER